MWRSATWGISLAILAAACRPAPTPAPPPMLVSPVLPGEFERVSTVLVVWDPDLSQFYDELLASATHSADAILITQEQDDLRAIDDELELAGVDLARISYVGLPHESIWVRDFGPLVTRYGHTHRIIDLEYRDRELDNAVAPSLGESWQLPTTWVPIELEGGNLLSNGLGTCVVSELTLEDNGFGYTEKRVRSMLQRYFGCDATVFVPYLEGEGTGHVDMYVSITSSHEAIVGSYRDDEDPANAHRTNVAAKRLEKAGFTVRRMPMPTNYDGQFRTHVNALVVNDIVFMPVYEADTTKQAEALATFHEAYPNRDIIPIDASALIRLGGAIHCAALTVGE